MACAFYTGRMMALLFLMVSQGAAEIRELPRTLSTPSPQMLTTRALPGSQIVYVSEPPKSGSASDFVIAHIIKLEKALQSGKELSDMELKKKDPLIKEIVSSVLDLQALGLKALSTHWDELGKTASGKKQRSRYESVFKNLVEENYLQKIRHYIRGQHQIHFTGELSGPTGVRVMARIQKKDVDVFVEFDVEKRGSSWKVVDTKLDETSLQETYRSSFNRIIRKNGGLAKGFPELLKAMDKRLAELRGGKATQL